MKANEVISISRHPLEGRIDVGRPAARLREIGQVEAAAVARQEAERAAQRERRIELGLGRADLVALGRCSLLRRAHVRPPSQQLHRDADGQLRWRLRDRAGRGEQIPELGWRQAKEYAQRVPRLLEPDFELRRLRPGLG